MTLKQAKKIVALMEDEGSAAKVYEKYSGRGMFGGTCVGIVTDSPSLVNYFGKQIRMKVRELPSRKDNMGLQTIVY